MLVTPGDIAFEFALPDQDGVMRRLSDYRGSWVVLYFYPKDDTPGCTTEACQFRDTLPRFSGLQAAILGISIDSVKRHKKFSAKYNLSFTLLSDETKQVVEQYGVWVKKKFMGREYMGIERSTLLIDPKGVVRKVYEQVKPIGHAEAVERDLVLLQDKN
jgi:peroxiredoxin Q/BCP